MVKKIVVVDEECSIIDQIFVWIWIDMKSNWIFIMIMF